MKKRLVTLLITVLLLLCTAIPAFAQPALPRLCDHAGLLDADEQSELLGSLDEISERLSFDVVIVTVNGTEGKSARDYADDYFDYNGFGQGTERDGALLLVSMDPSNRQAWISTRGSGITAMTDAGIDYMLDIIVDQYLANGEYYQACTAFASLSEEFVDAAMNGEPYDTGSMPRAPRQPLNAVIVLKWAGISAVIALIVAAIRIAAMKSGMKSIRSQTAANNYVRQNSLNVTNASELFLYCNVNRVRRETESSGSHGSSIHTSSSGASHGGGGRGF